MQATTRKVSNRVPRLARFGVPKIDPTGLVVVLVLLAVGACAVWAGLEYTRNQRRAELTRRLDTATQEYDVLAARLAKKPELQQRYQQAQAAIGPSVDRLFRPHQRLEVLGLLSGLADRASVRVNTVNLGEYTTAKLQGQTYQVLAISMLVDGSPEGVFSFVQELQSGRVPGLVAQRVQFQPREDKLGATVQLALYIWPSGERRT